MMLIDIMHYGMQVYNCQYAFEEDTVMQWYERTAQSLAGGTYYSHQDLIGRLRQDYPKLSDNSYHWAVSGLLKSGKIIRTGFDTYVIADGRNTAEYLPIYSEHAIKLIQQVESRYPFTGFTVFETVLMNEFLNHLIAQNTVFIQVEKESSIFVFSSLYFDIACATTERYSALLNVEAISLSQYISVSSFSRQISCGAAFRTGASEIMSVTTIQSFVQYKRKSVFVGLYST